jgi:hypothetical protein
VRPGEYDAQYTGAQKVVTGAARLQLERTLERELGVHAVRSTALLLLRCMFYAALSHRTLHSTSSGALQVACCMLHAVLYGVASAEALGVSRLKQVGVSARGKKQDGFPAYRLGGFYVQVPCPEPEVDDSGTECTAEGIFD